jgi:16S rRNA G527 N7-methylase RsmG
VSADATATRTKISARFDELGLTAHRRNSATDDYFCLLAKWNERINLTALPVVQCSDFAY